MKIAKSRLIQIIREEIEISIKEAVDTDGDGTPDYRDSDSDNDGIPDSEEASSSSSLDDDPKEMYSRMMDLKKKYQSDWEKLSSLGYSDNASLDDETYDEMLRVRDAATDYGKFYSDVGFDYDRRLGRRVYNNKFKLPHGSYIKSLFDKKSGFPVDELKSAYDEYKRLEPLFKTKRHKRDPYRERSVGSYTNASVEYVPTGETISTSKGW